jgi:hypothetical protein
MFDFHHYRSDLNKLEDMDRQDEIRCVDFQDVLGIPRELLGNKTQIISDDGMLPISQACGKGLCPPALRRAIAAAISTKRSL